MWLVTTRSICAMKLQNPPEISMKIIMNCSIAWSVWTRAGLNFTYFFRGTKRVRALSQAFELHERKILLAIRMDVCGIAFWKTYEKNITTNGERYKQFWEQYVKSWAGQHRLSRPVLLHYNARPHKTAIVCEFIKNEDWLELSHPPYSPDINPGEFNGFCHLKRSLSGTRYNNKQELDTTINEHISILKADRTLYGVLELPVTWKRVINNNGDYWLYPEIWLKYSLLLSSYWKQKMFVNLWNDPTF